MPSRGLLWLALVGTWLVAPGALAEVGDPGWEYCSGEGSICEAFYDTSSKCDEKTDGDYYKCICTSGYVPLNEACQNCQYYTGDSLAGGNLDFYSDLCEEQDQTVGPIPASIVSQQEERNETLTVPNITTTSTFSNTFNMDYTTNLHEPYTTTLNAGTVTEPLPSIGPATPTGAATPSVADGTVVAKCWGAASLAALLMMMLDR